MDWQMVIAAIVVIVAAVAGFGARTLFQTKFSTIGPEFAKDAAETISVVRGLADFGKRSNYLNTAEYAAIYEFLNVIKEVIADVLPDEVPVPVPPTNGVVSSAAIMDSVTPVDTEIHASDSAEPHALADGEPV